MQIWITRTCDKKCFHCTQNSQFGGKAEFITPEQYEQAIDSLEFGTPNAYFGVVGMFGGNPALHPQFDILCEILRAKVPFEQRGLWCNHPRGKGAIMEETFNPAVSNLNVHQDEEAWQQFLTDWPSTQKFLANNLKGLDQDSRHGPPLVAMSDVIKDEGERWNLIANCDINKYWSAMVCIFRGELRAYFCEIAGAHAMLHQHNPNYNGSGHPIPDVGSPVVPGWWRHSMKAYADQVKLHCHGCGIPLKGYGALANSGPAEQISAMHLPMVKLRDSRAIQQITDVVQLGEKHLPKSTDYIENGAY
jgi:organic radical activating enzyme